jgi:hypothetical protein
VEFVSQSSWWALVAHFESAGVPRDVWPIYDRNIDLPLDEILEENGELRKQISGLVVSDDGSPWVRLVLRLIRSEEVLFYCVE